MLTFLPWGSRRAWQCAVRRASTRGGFGTSGLIIFLNSHNFIIHGKEAAVMSGRSNALFDSSQPQDTRPCSYVD